MDWSRAARRRAAEGNAAGIFYWLHRLKRVRSHTQSFHASAPARPLAVPAQAVLAFTRGEEAPVICVANFSDEPQQIDASALGLTARWRDLISADSRGARVALAPYQVRWLVQDG
jgi:hypothetical protein